METDRIDMLGPAGLYINDNSVISFSYGQTLDTMAPPSVESIRQQQWVQRPIWTTVNGFNIANRGPNNLQAEEIRTDLRSNRLLPSLITKKVNFLYGHGLQVYHTVMVDGKLQKLWIDCPTITKWLNSWGSKGIEDDSKTFAKGVIKSFYYFQDYFVKWRMNNSHRFGGRVPVAGLELMDTCSCRLATTRTDVATNLTPYKSLSHVAVGQWGYGVSSFNFYPRFTINKLKDIKYAAISHHRTVSDGEYYGLNETHEGTKLYIKGANSNPRYINSFLKNALAAKFHIVIPHAWQESKRSQITKLCQENKKREQSGQDLLKYNEIEIGTEFKESTLVKYVQQELRKISTYLSGADNQGKAYASVSFKDNSGQEQRWKIEPLDLKYKEYITALIEYDKRADEVLLSAVGLDSSLSSVSKEGVISKSGADVYYNYLIYIISLTPDEEVCTEPFNMAIQINWPDLYEKGYRLGFYREVPARQEDVAPSNRLNQQQS